MSLNDVYRQVVQNLKAGTESYQLEQAPGEAWGKFLTDLTETCSTYGFRVTATLNSDNSVRVTLEKMD